MANEVTIPLLPCADVDEIAAFYEVLGFQRTYRQLRPNPYVALRREDLHLHFFGMPDYVAADSYSTCLVLTDDIEALHRAFADGMRAAYGKVLVSGLPRMTRPRRRSNNDGHTGFSLIDPGGNWIRITANPAASATAPSSPDPTASQPTASQPGADQPGADQPTASQPGADQPTASQPCADQPGASRPGGGRGSGGRLARALDNAVVLGDSKGDPRQALKALDGAIARATDADEPEVLAEALAYRAELAQVLEDEA